MRDNVESCDWLKKDGLLVDTFKEIFLWLNIVSLFLNNVLFSSSTYVSLL